jgi:hypothetical protein
MDPVDIPNFSDLGPHGVQPGASPMYPCTIFAHLLADGLEEFLIQSLYASAVRRCFDHSRLFVFHRKEHAHHQAVPSMFPDITYTWRGDTNTSIPMDYFDPSNHTVIRASDEFWYQQECHKPDIMLVPSMMDWRHLGAFERSPRLVLPRDRLPDINTALRGLGVDANWWFCAVAVPGHDTGARLDAFGASLHAIAEVITKQYAAGLVLVGDPETILETTPSGVIDARGLPDGTVGQAYVISKARFLIEPEASPWLWVAFGLDVPWSRRVNSVAAIKLPGRGFVFTADPGDADAHAAVARVMVHETRDCPIWRAPSDDDRVPARNFMDLPMRLGPDARVVTL